ncbi:MAG: hypothetical protein IKO83_11855 [Oscillospiraceae bacterium]|nr:hypothetical protein [Oscillospiraceae bacterium]
MDKGQALQAFWESFDIPAIDEQSSYDQATLDALGIGKRYITYEVSAGRLAETNLMLTGSLWYRETSWGPITRKAEEIAAFVGEDGWTQKIDGGYIHIMLPRGQVYRRALDPDTSYRRIIFNIEVMFLTSH